MKSQFVCMLILLMTILIGCTDASRKGAPVTIDLQQQEISLPDLIIGGPRGMVKKKKEDSYLIWYHFLMNCLYAMVLLKM